jgi:catechol-2,3-dioxygenase
MPRGLAELVLIVSDIPRAAAFYRDIVGLIPATEPTAEWAWFWAGEPGVPQRLAVHTGTLLFEEHSPHPPGRRFGRVHFALNVPRPELAAALERVGRGGIAIHGPVHFEWMKADSWYFYDPDGNLVEFWVQREG